MTAVITQNLYAPTTPEEDRAANELLTQAVLNNKLEMHRLLKTPMIQALLKRGVLRYEPIAE